MGRSRAYSRQMRSKLSEGALEHGRDGGAALPSARALGQVAPGAHHDRQEVGLHSVGGSAL